MISTDAAVGTHPTIDLGCGTLCTFNYDSLISSAIAIVATLAVAFWVRSRLREGEPSKVQAIFEWGYDQLRSLIKTNVSDDALFIIPLAMTLFLYILIANWIEVLPLAFSPILSFLPGCQHGLLLSCSGSSKASPSSFRSPPPVE